MNIGIITSFVVGGLLLLSILSFNGQVLNNGIETTISVITQQTLRDIVELANNDFSRVGYQTGNSNPFNKIQNGDIIFEADVYDNDSFSVTNVRWRLTNSQVTATSNPNDFYLERTGPLTNSTYGTTRFPVTHFNIVYRTANDVITTNPAIVKKIELEIVLESPEPYKENADGEKLYQRTVWKRTFVPNNINLPY